MKHTKPWGILIIEQSTIVSWPNIKGLQVMRTKIKTKQKLLNIVQDVEGK